MLNLQVAHRSLQVGRPVDQISAFIDQAIVIEALESGLHRPREALVERETLARPVAACAHAPHLVLDTAAILGLPLPGAAQELLAADQLAAGTLAAQQLLDLALGRNAGVIGARQPERFIALHAPPAGH